jgi:hypothetical protein
MFDSDEHYFRSRNRALQQDSHPLRESTRDLRTVPMFYVSLFSLSVSSVSIFERFTLAILGEEYKLRDAKKQLDDAPKLEFQRNAQSIVSCLFWVCSSRIVFFFCFD